MSVQSIKSSIIKCRAAWRTLVWLIGLQAQTQKAAMGCPSFICLKKRFNSNIQVFCCTSWLFPTSCWQQQTKISLCLKPETSKKSTSSRGANTFAKHCIMHLTITGELAVSFHCSHCRSMGIAPANAWSGIVRASASCWRRETGRVTERCKSRHRRLIRGSKTSCEFLPVGPLLEVIN